MGPYHGEVGFEALYWLPWLAKIRRDLKIARDRWIPISRGGSSAWYDVPKGLELYAMRTPQEIRVENRIQRNQTGQLKQTGVTPFERQIYRDAAKTLGLDSYLTLHPAWMYQALVPFYTAQKGIMWLEDQVSWDVLPPSPLPDGLTLPEQFVAVRFYARATFPPNPQTAEFARETIRTLAENFPVILLNSGVHADEHVDFTPKPMANVTQLSELYPMNPETNLAVQSAVIARSLGFVGTYGGLAQLALRFRKPVISIYSEWHGTALAHKHLSDAVALQLGVPFHVLGIRDLPLLQAVLPAMMLDSPQHIGEPVGEPA